MLRFEEQARKSLLVLSNLDVTVTALTRTYPEQSEPDPLLMRALYRCIQGLQVLTDLTSATLHQAVTRRKDTSINGKLNNQKHPVAVSEEHLAQLRNGPLLGTRDLFDPDLVRRIQAERATKKSDDLQAVALNRLASSQFKRPHTASATASVAPERQPKKRKGLQLPQQQRVVQAKAESQSPSAQASQSSVNR